MTDERVPADLVMRYRRATGLPVLAAKRALISRAPSEWLPLIVATENQPQTDGFAHDPLEDDDVTGPIIKAVLADVTQRVTREYDEHIALMRTSSPDVADVLSTRRGICHTIWRESQSILREEHGIHWRTPVELNPQTVFD